MHFLQGLLDGEPDSWVHDVFIKYGRGSFVGPVCDVEVKKDVRFKCSVEYVNLFGGVICSGEGDVAVDGGLFSKIDFRPLLSDLGFDYADKSKKNYYVANVKGDYPASMLRKVYDAHPEAYILFNLKSDSGALKCKKKPPKPGKDKVFDFSGGHVVSGLQDALFDELLFDSGRGFRKAFIENVYRIDELIIPEGMDAAAARLNAKRAGKIIRKVVLDGVENVSEVPFKV
jgi:hypothetical protein